MQHYRKGEYVQAIALGERAAVIDPDLAISYRLNGDALDEMDKEEEAIANYRKAIALKPSDAMTVGNMANAYAKMGKGSEATRYYQEALRIDPNMAEARAGLGYQHMKQGEFSQAAQHLAIAVQLKPDYGIYSYNLGLSCAFQEKFQAALHLTEPIMPSRLRCAVLLRIGTGRLNGRKRPLAGPCSAPGIQRSGAAVVENWGCREQSGTWTVGEP